MNATGNGQYHLDVAMLANVPAELTARPQWVTWRYETREGKPTKVPYRADGGGHASHGNAATWATFDDAIAAYRRNPVRFNGVGYVFSADDEFCGVDFDHALDAAGDLMPWAKELFDQIGGADTYAEVSPSGEGLKLITRGKLPGGGKRRGGFGDGGGVEVYDRLRYFTITGRRFPECDGAIGYADEGLAELYATLSEPKPAPEPAPAPPPPPTDPVPDLGEPDGAEAEDDDDDEKPEPLTDEQLIDRAKRAKNGAKFGRLYGGDASDHGGDESAADQSLANHLLWWCDGDQARADRMFRASGLMREKWDRVHNGDGRTYGRMTLDKAAASFRGPGYVPKPKKKATDGVTAGGVVDDEGLVPLGQRDPDTGRLVLSPKRALPTALAAVGEFYTHGGLPTLVSYAGSFCAWAGNRYATQEDGAIRQRLAPWLHDAVRYHVNPRTEETRLVAFDSNPGTVTAVLDTLRAHVHLPASVTPPRRG